MEAPEEFPFPFPPYEIQTKFMKELYECLENGKLGIFESPTGTGKSLSIICGALKWLIDHQAYRKAEIVSKINDVDERIKKLQSSSDNWFTVQTEQMELNVKKQELQAKLNAILKYENKRKTYKDSLEKEYEVRKDLHKKSKPRGITHENRTDGDSLATEESLLEDLIPEDISSDSNSSAGDDTEEELFRNTKIFFCSRTHSQLSQLVKEAKRSPYSEDVSVVVLASRQNYCINNEVKKLRHANLINEQCLLMQRRKATDKQEKDVKRSKKTSNCQYLPGVQRLLMASVLTEIQDVEEIVQRARESSTCPYYASRKSIEDGQLILVPYNSVLHKSTRISSGIDLKGHVLVIDEAHNLLDAIERMHSASVTGRNLLHCYGQLSRYQKRYHALFSARSVLRLSQLSFCLKKLLTIFGATAESTPSDAFGTEQSPKMYKIEDFEAATQIDTLNVFELLDFVKKSKLVRKLQGFTEQDGNALKIRENPAKRSGVKEFLSSIKKNGVGSEESSERAETPDADERSNNPIMPIVSFLECLKSNWADGRIFVVPASTIGQGVVKFLLLNPASRFRDIVRDARAVVLAGGTMEPVSEFTDQLLLTAGAEAERIVTFSCDHVIPPENIVSNIVTRGPTGLDFEFNYQTRRDARLLDELGRALVNLCNVVPAGIVVFLPSYGYEETVYEHLEGSGVIGRILARKRIFREPKSASQASEVLERYASSVKSPRAPQNGSLLFSVVGGKLSEGLNFSDDLGRCVVVVGMPYPNVKSPELREKIQYLNENVRPGAGQSFYENSCMKAVNQCIGRAVRHVDDYSTVVLLDKRYRGKEKALPRWIRRSLTVSDAFGKTVGNMAKFFAAKRISK